MHGFQGRGEAKHETSGRNAQSAEACSCLRFVADTSSFQFYLNELIRFCVQLPIVCVAM
jgi:hypothetical protein